jgi:TRAP-type mannitol/chloroaromatic compound transport system permease small subunit
LKVLLTLSRAIDAINEYIGRGMCWLVLATVLISAGNAVVRKAFNYSSNSLLEIQWYLFAMIFLLCAGYTLKHNEHVRIDIITSRFSARVRAGIDIFGTLFFLLPVAGLILWLSWPVFVEAYTRNEVSTNAGGLVIWPARLMIPVGFALLMAQAVSELIKRIAFLRGLIADPAEKIIPRPAEDERAEDVLSARGEQAAAGTRQ